MTNLFKKMPKSLQDMYGRDELFMMVVNKAEAADVEYVDMLEKTIEVVFDELSKMQEIIANQGAL